MASGSEKKKTSFLLATEAMNFSFQLIKWCKSLLNFSFLSSYLGEYFFAQRFSIQIIHIADRGVLDFWKGLSAFIISDQISSNG